MAMFTAQEGARLEALGRLNFINPFAPERIKLEETILGSSRPASDDVWNMHSGSNGTRAAVRAIGELATHWAKELRKRTGRTGFSATPAEDKLYDAVVIYHLFEKYRQPMTERMVQFPDETEYPVYRDFARDFLELAAYPGRKTSFRYEPERSFAIFFQIHRAFHHIFSFIVGGTLAAGGLRAAIWQSIFSHDIDRYFRVLYDKMNGITTLITGESGTGKELVARAIALSQYIPFDAKTCRFAYPYTACFLPVQLSAMPQTMIESELFGHRKGAFTGATGDRIGYFEGCVESGSVFLDEIGEIPPETQVKLLRVLQSRKFQRLGDNRLLEFRGKIIAATNRDLGETCRTKTFRNDLYYRLCADTVSTVPLRELVSGDDRELEHFVAILSERILGHQEAARFTPEAVRWIRRHLGASYPWPGNVRELEQCVRNLVIRGEYTPAATQETGELETALDRTDLTWEELLRLYLRRGYNRLGSCQAVAEFAGLDRRTVKKYLS